MPESTLVIYSGYICLTLLCLILLTRIGSLWIKTLEARLGTEEVLERYEILKATTESFSSTIGSLLTNLLHDINDTNELLNQIPSSSREGKRLHTRLLEAQKRIQSPEIHAIIIRAVNDSNDGIVDLFSTHFPDLAEEQSITFALSAGRVSPKIASLVLGIRPKSFYVRRDRLRDSISKSSATDPAVREHLIGYLTARPDSNPSPEEA